MNKLFGNPLSEVYKINKRIKEDAIVQQCASTQRILSNNVLTASAVCAIKMPSISHIKTRISNIKQQQKGSGPIPKTDDFEIPEKYLTKKKGDDFLFEDIAFLFQMEMFSSRKKVSGLWNRIQFEIA